jgi:polysaccharide biosynthesis/export protein
VVAKILQFELTQLSTNRAALEKEHQSLKRQIEQSDAQIALVTEQLEKSKQGLELAMAELERVQALFQKGLTPVNRVAEERRLTLLTQTQSLQATERLGQVKKDREELSRKLERLQDQRRVELNRELQDANMKLAQIRTRLQAVDEKLTYAGLLKSQLTRGKGATPELIIHRQGPTGRERIAANEDTELIPGDTIEVSLRSQVGIGAAQVTDRVPGR